MPTCSYSGTLLLHDAISCFLPYVQNCSHRSNIHFLCDEQNLFNLDLYVSHRFPGLATLIQQVCQQLITELQIHWLIHLEQNKSKTCLFCSYSFQHAIFYSEIFRSSWQQLSTGMLKSWCAFLKAFFVTLPPQKLGLFVQHQQFQMVLSLLGVLTI